MNFTANSSVDINWTSLQGFVTASRKQLTEVFGEPDTDDESTAIWCILFEEGVVASIYDQKRAPASHEPYEWHVGGHDQRAVNCVIWAIKEKEENEYKEGLQDVWEKATEYENREPEYDPDYDDLLKEDDDLLKEATEHDWTEERACQQCFTKYLHPRIEPASRCPFCNSRFYHVKATK